MKTLGIVGLGLIGGSLAAAARRAGRAVVAYDKCGETADAARAAGGDIAASPAAVADAADIIVIAAPVMATAQTLKILAPHLRDDHIVSDVGSTKQFIAAAAAKHLREKRRRFVPAHPVAGREQSGFAAADAGLFAGRAVVVCAGDADEDAAAAVRALWQDAGARTAEMTPARHDRLFAFVSHLPHVLAYALVGAIGAREDGGEMMPYAAGGFRDFTRIAGSDAEMWRDICLSNRDNLLAAVREYRRRLETLEAHIAGGDGGELRAGFAAAQTLRRQWLDTLENFSS